jgi:phage terminase large subunit
MAKVIQKLGIKRELGWLYFVDKQGKILNEPEHIFSHTMDAVRYAFSGYKPAQDVNFDIFKTTDWG